MKLKLANNDKVLCAKFRVGHFEGVLGVINQLLKNIKAKYIFLGEKDYQQIYLIKNFIKNKFNTKVLTFKTVRSKDNLPLSSRNKLLSKDDILIASKISNKLKLFYISVKKDFKKKNKLDLIKKEILKYNIKLEYLEIRNNINLSKKINKFNFKIFIAYYIKGVRLIDNF